MQIVVCVDSFGERELETLRQSARACGDHQVDLAPSEAEALRLAPRAEAVLGFLTPAVNEAAPHLRWVQHHGAGMDKALFPELIERDEVVVTNMAGLYARQVSEQAWALLLALSRSLATALANQRQGLWQGGPVVEISGGTLLVIGMGGIGVQLARKAKAFDMEVLGLDPVRRQAPPEVAELHLATRENLHALLQRADAAICACPLTSATRGLIGEAELAAMRPSTFLINVARGGIVDQEALAAALHTGQIAGAALDVCEPEPLPPGDPLWSAPNLILTPHQAGSSQHRPGVVLEFFRAQLQRFLRGEDLHNQVGKQRGF